MGKPLILFDMDGTLIHYEEELNQQSLSHYKSIKQQMKEVAVAHGLPEEDINEADRMAHIWNATRALAEKHGFTYEQIQSLMSEVNVPFMVEERADHSMSVLIPDTVQALQRLQDEGYQMGMVTTASRESYERISKSPEFGAFGRFFRYSITRDDCDYIKPDPEPMHRMLKLYDRSDFVYVGDSDHDAQAAKAVNGYFVLLNTREYDKDKIEQMKADAVIYSLLGLPDLLKSLP